MTLFAKTVAERTRPGQRQDVEEQDYTFHAYGRTEGICGIIISDHQYPALVAHQLLSKVVDEFLAKHPRSSWASGSPTLPMPELNEYLAKYQDPSQADSIMKIQKELDETKIVLHKTIESVLQRGEKIDDLVAKSDGLSAQSKMFYRECKPYRPRVLSLPRLTIFQNKQRSKTRAACSCRVDRFMFRRYLFSLGIAWLSRHFEALLPQPIVI
jgi:synaptobrevin homolog YKT6